ncbi:MAG: alpha/beta hydrolase [Burkholderiaceae bacterium]
MPTIRTDDGVRLYYEEAGSGTPIVFVHEFAGDHRSWEPQLRHFSRRYRCIAYSARGYLPSDVPQSPDRYSQERVRDDIVAVLDALGIACAHVVGCSMGAFAALHFGMAYCTTAAPSRALSLTLVGCGSGAHPAVHQQFKDESVARAGTIRRDGMAELAATYGHGAARVQYLNKDPRGFAEYAAQLAEHSAAGSANTMEGYQGRRPSLYALTQGMAGVAVPVLVVCGDEDDACLEASILIKRVVPKAGLVVLPKTGHAVNLEEPLVFNQMLDAFLHQVAQGRWGVRDPRAVLESIWGPGGEPAAARG